MPLAIRQVTPATLGLLDRVADDVFDAAIDRQRAALWLASPRALLVVAVADGLVVGQAAGMILHHADQPDELYIDNLGVAPDWQRRGVGSALVDALVRQAATAGCRNYWVLAEPGNAVARAFYAARGLIAEPALLYAGVIGPTRSAPE